MTSIAELGIKVDSTDAAQASSDLDKLTAAGGRAEKSVRSVAAGAEKLEESTKRSSSKIKDQAKDVDASAEAFRKLYGGTTAAAAGMFSLENSIKNGSFVKSLSATKEAEKWLASLTSTTKDASAAFLDSGTKLTFMSSGMKGLGAWAGSGTPVFGQIAKQSADAAVGLGVFSKTAVQSEMSAKAMQNALRGVPAQFTDIVTSIQGGQAPLTVFLQQGGQLKDMFGGAGPAAKALGGYVLGLVNPFTLLAAAVAGTSIAYYKGSKEADEYNKSLILTGGAAGVTAGQLADMAQQVSATVGTTGAAAEVLASLAGSGKLASASYLDIARAAVSMQEATGKAVSETIGEFNKLAGDPVKASATLNEQYHYLTASVYSQIVALEEQGKHADAVKLATDQYADAINDRTPKILENLSLWEKAYNLVAKAADGLKEIGRAPTNAERIQTARDTLGRLETRGGSEMIPGEDTVYIGEKGKQSLKDYIKGLEVKDAAETEYARKQKERADIELAGQKAIDKIDARRKATRSNADKRKDELDDLNKEIEALRRSDPANSRLSQTAIEQQRAAILAKYKDPKTPAGSVNLTEFNDSKNQLSLILSEYKNAQKELDAAQKAGLISQQAYFDQRSALVRAEREEVSGAYQAEIDALEASKGKASTSAAQRIQLDQKIADARANMVKAQKEADSELEVIATNEQGRLAKQAQAIKSYTDALDQQNVALRRAGSRAADGVGRGDRENAINGELIGIADRANQQRLDLARDKADQSRNMSAEEYQAKLDAINKSEKDLSETVLSNYEQMSEAQSDWRKGATSAFSNYLESARNVAGQTRDLFTNAFSSMEDAVANFAITGKFSFADFTKSILADMARIAARTAASEGLSALFGLAASAAGSYFGGGASSAGSTQAGYAGDLSGFTPGSIQAKGGAWSGGVQMFANGAAFTNSIVSKPTAFGMAGGGIGVMGEAGEEAIMPLTRTAGGQLGVRAISSGGSGGGNVYNFPVAVSVQTTGDGGATTTEDTTQLGKGIQQAAKTEAETAIARGLQPGGAIWRVINGRA